MVHTEVSHRVSDLEDAAAGSSHAHTIHHILNMRPLHVCECVCLMSVQSRFHV